MKYSVDTRTILTEYAIAQFKGLVGTKCTLEQQPLVVGYQCIMDQMYIVNLLIIRDSSPANDNC